MKCANYLILFTILLLSSCGRVNSQDKTKQQARSPSFSSSNLNQAGSPSFSSSNPKIVEFNKEKDQIYNIAFSRNGKYVAVSLIGASLTTDNDVSFDAAVFDVDSGNLVKKFKTSKKDKETTDRRRIIFSHDDKELLVFSTGDIETDEETFNPNTVNIHWSHADQKMIKKVGSWSKVRKPNAILQSWSINDDTTNTFPIAYTHYGAFSDTGRYFIHQGKKDDHEIEYIVWNLSNTSFSTLKLKTKSPLHHVKLLSNTYLDDIMFYDDATLIRQVKPIGWTEERLQWIELVDIKTGNTTKTIELPSGISFKQNEHTNYKNINKYIAVCSNHKYMAIAGNKKYNATGDGVILIYDLPQNKVIHRIEDFNNTPRLLAFSPDGKYLASTGAARETKSTGGLWREIVNESDPYIRIWSVETGEEVERKDIKNYGEVDDLMFSPDGKYLAAALRPHRDWGSNGLRITGFSAVLLWDKWH